MSVQRLADINLHDVSLHRTKISLESIEADNKRQLEIPLFQDVTYKKGVYKTFDEFKMDNPSFTDYELVEDKYTKTILVKDIKGAYPIRDVWGYSDGKHLYIQSADNYFELLSRQNTFICNGAKALSRYRVVKAGNVLTLGTLYGSVGRQNKKVIYNLDLKPFELDMDTGRLF
jgi:hypothetical protein